MYILLSPCQGIVGHREGDFDYDTHMCLMRDNLQNTRQINIASNPGAMLSISLVIVHDQEQKLDI
jgi:hypothetical protein